MAEQIRTQSPSSTQQGLMFLSARRKSTSGEKWQQGFANSSRRKEGHLSIEAFYPLIHFLICKARQGKQA